MHKLGTITRLHIQTASLKIGQRPYVYYDPANILAVPALRLTPAGVVGLVDGREIVDVHNANHPQSKKREENGISFNFSGHYRKMSERFGSHLAPGCAGENILIANESVFDATAFTDGLLIETAEGHMVRLTAIEPATPCAPFSEYALCMEMKPPAALLRETLQFLDGGTRGFYTTLQGEPATVRVGDSVFLMRET
ncbi:MAG: MOSC domain-containing protein [Chloroflexaceae bacterium]|jgi:hypothetical protein|nr:MOSC domain-containing protein [Chloroflexaceae bacterium]